MLTKKRLEAEIVDLVGLRGFVEVYEEIAADRMQDVRTAVLTSRQFLDGLSSVFAEVKQNYVKGVEKWEGKSKLNRNGRTVVVFLSANSGLYGDILNRTFEEFLAFLKTNPKADAVVVGKLGLRLLQERVPTMLYNYFDFSDSGVEQENLGMIMRYLLQFEKILVFYGKFQNVVVQNPAQTSVSGDELAPAGGEQTMPRNMYLFEPSVEGVLEVFESQILTSIFEQTMHESQLAKYASRLMHLDQAVENIGESLVKLGLESRRLKHKIDNKKQQARMAGVSLWM